jgi:hypothetical protein
MSNSVEEREREGRLNDFSVDYILKYNFNSLAHVTPCKWEGGIHSKCFLFARLLWYLPSTKSCFPSKFSHLILWNQILLASVIHIIKDEGKKLRELLCGGK